MLYVGKLDYEIYKCAAEDITTDEVVMTDERIDHVRIRHPNDYERYEKYFLEIIQKPDYILKQINPIRHSSSKKSLTAERGFK